VYRGTADVALVLLVAAMGCCRRWYSWAGWPARLRVPLWVHDCAGWWRS